MAFANLTRGLKFDKQHNAIALARLTGDDHERPAKRRRTDHAVSSDALRKSHKIKCQGDNVPDPIASFEDLQSICEELNDDLLEGLGSFGWINPTPCQMQAIPIMLHDRDLLCCSPTGSGKTLAFLLPLFAGFLKGDLGLRSLIVIPTRELASQVYNQAQLLGRRSGWKAHLLAAKPDKSAVDADVVVTTPLRLIYALKSKSIDLSQLQTVVFDEADKLLEDEFLAQIDFILDALPKKTQKVFFSATIPSGFEQMANNIMSADAVRIICGSKDAAAELIQQELLFCANEEGKLSTLLGFIKDGGLQPPALIFVQSVERAKDLGRELERADLRADAIHSDKGTTERDDALTNFANGKTWILVTTDVLARGIDFKDVNLVINYDVPPTAMAYIHRVGRTGRNGRPGRSITLFTNDDAPYLKSLANVLRNSSTPVPEWILRLKTPSRKQKQKLKQRPVERKSVRHSHGYPLVSKSKQGKKKQPDTTQPKTKKRKMVDVKE